MAQAQRKDPVFRSTDGAKSASVKNANPERHYVAVYKNDPMQGPEYYQDMGYNFVDPGKDPERMRGFRDRGEGSSTLEGRGHVLMWISKKQLAHLRRVGADGESGERLADQFQEAILDRDSVNGDTFRGQQGRMKLMHGVEAPTPFDI